ncbi:MAG: hypothetical protein HY598_02265 [Candidatus Omnitrophica bacterium]|nr:hypothetical protein [Candidatus Omnitrophota bacterium]
MRHALLGVIVAVLMAGCARGGRRSSLLLERYARGQLAEAALAGGVVDWRLKPVTQAQEQKGVEVNVAYASQEYLRKFFSDKSVFKEFAGQDPYFPENLIFYVKIANKSAKKIRISPAEFLLVDDRGNQYALLNVDYVTAYAEFKAPFSTMTRGVVEEARPGYFGLSLPVGKLVAARPQGRFALIQQSSLQSGYLHPGVVHDGLVAFWNPNRLAKKVRLLLTNIKTDYDASDFPQTALEFLFTFETVTP